MNRLPGEFVVKRARELHEVSCDRTRLCLHSDKPVHPRTCQGWEDHRNPEERAQELSQATGVPSPFYVAFSLPFVDCDNAERYFHTLLEIGGFRVAENREFFKVSLNEAIRLLLEVQQKLASSQANAQLSTYSDDSPASAQLGEQLYDKAMELFWGEGDVIEDRDQAIELLEKAVGLDYPPAYVQLAQYYSHFRDSPDIKVALTILRDGIEHGHDG